MNKLIASIKREYLEEVRSYISLSAIVGGLILLTTSCLVIAALVQSTSLSPITHEHNAAPIIHTTMRVISLPFSFVLWLSVFQYFLSCLYTDRKDGSILFWLSMPVNTRTTIAAKVITGLFIAPFMASIGILLTTLGVCFFLFIVPIHMNLWMYFPVLHPITLFQAWLHVLVILWQQGLWLLPLFAWCLLCSAQANKAPAVRAIVLPLIVIVLEFTINKTHVVSTFISTRFSYGSSFIDSTFQHIRLNSSTWYQHTFGDTTSWLTLHHQGEQFVIGLIIAAVCIALATFLRYRCYGFDR